MSSDRIIKSYVWHGDKCFFVSTIERDSSAMEGPRRFNETMVWVYHWNISQRGELTYQDGDCEGSIESHLNVCRRLQQTGKPEDSNDY